MLSLAYGRTGIEVEYSYDGDSPWPSSSSMDGEPYLSYSVGCP